MNLSSIGMALSMLPTWAVALAICGMAVALTLAAQMSLHRRWSVDDRKPLNEVTGFIIAVVGVVYAVLLASIAVVAIERYDRAENVVEQEAGYVSDIYRTAEGLPQNVRVELRAALVDYVVSVVDGEWAAMEGSAAERDWQEQGWRDIERLIATLAAYEPATQGEQLFMQEILSQVSALQDSRRARMFMAVNPIEAVIWWVMVIGGLSTVALALLFGVPSRGHLLVSGVLAFSIALVMLLVFVMDAPFVGSSRVTAEPFAYVQERMAGMTGGNN